MSKLRLLTLLNKMSCFFLPLAIILLLAFAIAPVNANKMNTLGINAKSVSLKTSIYSPINSPINVLINPSVIKHNDSSFNFGVTTGINQATSFNHSAQLNVNYLFVLLLSLFIVAFINYRYFKRKITPPPWYLCLRHHSRLSIASVNPSNLLYQAQHYHK